MENNRLIGTSNSNVMYDNGICHDELLTKSCIDIVYDMYMYVVFSRDERSWSLLCLFLPKRKV